MKIVEAYEGALMLAPRLTLWWLLIHILNVIMAGAILIGPITVNLFIGALCCLVIYLAGNGGRAIYDDVMYVKGARRRIKRSACLQLVSFLPLAAFWLDRVRM